MATIDTVEKLRELYEMPNETVIKKVISKLDVHTRRFLDASPFLVIGSFGNGGGDVTPRGDPAGSIAVLDDRTLLIPDRPGNNRLDTLENIIENPEVGLLFLVPGLGETLRMNGTAEIVIGPELGPLAQNGRLPRSAIKFTIREVYFQCAKALIRSKLWDPDSRVSKDDFPPLGQVIAEQVAGVDAETETKKIDAAYQSNLS